MKPLSHLTIRVAWHDSQWNGTVCAKPELNSFCVALSRIRESKSADEDKLAGRGFDKLSLAELPPCKAESGFFIESASLGFVNSTTPIGKIRTARKRMAAW